MSQPNLTQSFPMSSPDAKAPFCVSIAFNVNCIFLCQFTFFETMTLESIQTANYIWRLSLTQAILPGHEAIRPGEIFSSSAG